MKAIIILLFFATSLFAMDIKDWESYLRKQIQQTEQNLTHSTILFDIIKPYDGNGINHQLYSNCTESDKIKLLNYGINIEKNTLDGYADLIISSHSLNKYIDIDPNRKYNENGFNKKIQLNEQNKRHIKHPIELKRYETSSPLSIGYEIHSNSIKYGKITFDFREKNSLAVSDIQINSDQQGKGMGLGALQTFLTYIDSNPNIFPNVQSFFLRDASEINNEKTFGLYQVLGFVKHPLSANGFSRLRSSM